MSFSEMEGSLSPCWSFFTSSPIVSLWVSESDHAFPAAPLDFRLRGNDVESQGTLTVVSTLFDVLFLVVLFVLSAFRRFFEATANFVQELLNAR